MFRKNEIEKLGWPSIDQYWQNLPIWLATENTSYDLHPAELAPIIGLARFLKAKNILDIGVSSGRTAAFVLQALKHDKIHSTVYGIDLAEFTHFNSLISVGQVIYENFPEFAAQLKLFTGHTTFNLDEILDDQEIDLAIIDGNAVHPWPTVDLLLAVPYLTKDAYIVLRNIVAVDSTCKGSNYLFQQWQGEKYQFHNHYPTKEIENQFAGIQVLFREKKYDKYLADTLANTAVIKLHDTLEKNLIDIFEILAIQWEGWQNPDLSFHTAQVNKLKEFIALHYGEVWSKKFEKIVESASRKILQNQINDGEWIFNKKNKVIDSYLNFLPKNINSINWQAFEAEIPFVENIFSTKSNVITLCFIIKEADVKYFGITLKSVLDTHQGNAFFDIILFTYQLSKETRNFIIQEFTAYNDRLAIRFQNITKIILMLEQLRPELDLDRRLGFSKLFAMKILSKFDKYFFIDNDLILNADITSLFDNQPNDEPLCGVLDNINHNLGQSISHSNPTIKDFKDYVTGHLGLTYGEYINSGVTLWYPDNISKEDRFNVYKYLFCDFNFGIQDIINLGFQGRKEVINNRKNFSQNQKSYGSNEDDRNVELPKIIFFKDIKPWISEDARLGEYWWKYARQMSYYEPLLHDFVMAGLPQPIIHQENSNKVTEYIDVEKEINFDKLLELDPLTIDYHHRIINLKMTFRITKEGFVKNNPIKAKMLKPFYKLFKGPTKYIAKKLILPLTLK